MKKINQLTISEARKLLDAGEISSHELTQACLDETRSLNGALNAFVEVYEDDALASARQSDARLAAGKKLGALDGIPLGMKDNILIQGKKATAGSKILSGYVATTDATVTRKLKEQGAVFVGRANMDEFAMGSSTERSAYGPTKHQKIQNAFLEVLRVAVRSPSQQIFAQPPSVLTPVDRSVSPRPFVAL
jgi:aspartyl-tRNA(Asn)/glutamyl-tRNA(Gln) amidotransferase subunit A